MIAHVYIVLAAFFFSISQSFLKYQLNLIGDFPKGILFFPFVFKLLFTNIWVMGWAFTSVIGTFCWLGALSRLELSIAFPYISGLTFTMVTVLSFFWFREPVAIYKIVGIGIIFFGIIVTAK